MKRVNKTEFSDGLAEPDTRARILEAALAEFARHGFAGARVDHIAQLAGINKAMIYYHFASKDKLYESAIEEYVAGFIGELSGKVSSGEGIEGILESMADTYRRVLGSDPYARQILLRELAYPRGKILSRIASVIRDSGVPATLAAILREGAKVEKFRPIDVRQAQASFVLMNIGYFLMAPIINEVLALEDIGNFVNERRSAVIDLFLNGVRAR
ncbi:MAG: TetR/AcrR family transcriptional regulator [candidate division Zixibacteria bacterium]|nr:TetR/AcrR family transcriptional regulator [candidate division Zixibacteria bacterium]